MYFPLLQYGKPPADTTLYKISRCTTLIQRFQHTHFYVQNLLGYRLITLKKQQQTFSTEIRSFSFNFMFHIQFHTVCTCTSQFTLFTRCLVELYRSFSFSLLILFHFCTHSYFKFNTRNNTVKQKISLFQSCPIFENEKFLRSIGLQLHRRRTVFSHLPCRSEFVYLKYEFGSREVRVKYIYSK